MKWLEMRSAKRCCLCQDAAHGQLYTYFAQHFWCGNPFAKGTLKVSPRVTLAEHVIFRSASSRLRLVYLKRFGDVNNYLRYLGT